MTRAMNDDGVGRSELDHVWIEIDGDATTALDVRQELTVTGAKVEDRCVGADVSLKEMSTEDLPHRALCGQLGLREAGGIQA